MIAVERLEQFSPDADKGLEIEEQKVMIAVPFGWPQQGVISFNNVYFRHRSVHFFVIFLKYNLLLELYIHFWLLCNDKTILPLTQMNIFIVCLMWWLLQSCNPP